MRLCPRKMYWLSEGMLIPADGECKPKSFPLRALVDDKR